MNTQNRHSAGRTLNTTLCLIIALAAGIARAQAPAHTFHIANGHFLLDGKPMQIISGEMHFARIPRECWRDRLKMARAMGLNTIATYVFWNYHEQEPGKYYFGGNADVASFVKMAGEEGLWVLIRPSPYACAEWEFGGYPWWLLNEKTLKVRSTDPRFLQLCTAYYKELGRQLAPLQITHGGNIIMVQIENEYGSYGSDKEYLARNREIVRNSGFDVELYTCDGPSQMGAGYLPGALPAVNGLDDTAQVREVINRYHSGVGPYFIAEWYPAWFDTWGEEHHVVPAREYLARLDAVLSAGCSINMYMVHGGTTRGFMNGANYDDRHPYAPQTSSYDYDAPIDEAGNATAKYTAFRDVIAKHLPPGTQLPPVPVKKPVISVPRFRLTEEADLLAGLPAPVTSERPLSFEDMRQGYGYVLYRTELKGPADDTVCIQHLRDYGIVFLNGRRAAVLDRRLGRETARLVVPDGGATLDILVENLGRINFGPWLNDNWKGITERVTFGGTELTGWRMYGFPCDDPAALFRSGSAHAGGPVVRRGTFTLSDTGDTYVDMSDWGKGCVWVNGHHLGRYWYIGPQQTLYVPAPWLKRGSNEIIVLELLESSRDSIGMLSHPILDQLAAPPVSLRGEYDAARGACVLSLETRGAGASIFYTTDGSEPTMQSALYNEKLTFSGPASVAARAFRKGIPSETVGRVDIRPSLSTGRPLQIMHQYSHHYAAGGPGALVDGFEGSTRHDDGLWQGYEGVDLDAVVDLGRVTLLQRVSSRYLQDTYRWIFFPATVEYSVSEDGVKFVRAAALQYAPAARDEEPAIRSCESTLTGVRARYVRVHAHSIGVCPPWHAGAGGKAWLFCDEITIE